MKPVNSKKWIWLAIAGVLVLLLVIGVYFRGSLGKMGNQTAQTSGSKQKTVDIASVDPANIREIYLAGGCFWGIEAYMSRIVGVIDAVSGYANGKTENPSYEDLIYSDSGHAETVLVRYDSSKITLDELLIYYFRVIEPTSLNKQVNDEGTQYRTGIYYLDPVDLPVIENRIQDVQKDYEEPVVVEVDILRQFFNAEDYHQDYLDKNPSGYCHIDLSQAEIPIN